MNKDHLHSAMEKINASTEFKNRVKNRLEQNTGRKQGTNARRLVPVMALIIAVIAFGSWYLPTRFHNLELDSNSGEFKIKGKINGEADYISAVYLSGYVYSPSSWISYQRDGVEDAENFEIGGKIGEVTLDLKGLKYTGTPPDFSSTHDVGTQIYEIKNVKPERAVIVRLSYGDIVFYRSYKAIYDESIPLDLSMSEVMQMMTENITVSSVELRSEQDGSWMRTSEKKELIDLINQELPGQSLLTRLELDKELDSYRVPINLMFEDGAALHMQFYPEQHIASVFGGYIKISEELAKEILSLNNEGDMYDKITDVITEDLNTSPYLYFKDLVKDKEVICSEPAWTGGAWDSLLSYFRVKEVEQPSDMQSVMIMKVGNSDTDFIETLSYEDENKHIILQINGEYYETVKGYLSYKQLSQYLESYIDWETIN